MRVCVVAEHYPRRRDPVLGVWAHRQALAARDAGADVRVLVLERPVPPLAAARALLRGDPRPLARSVTAFAAQPRHDRRDGLEVEHVRFLAPPRERAYAGWHRHAARPLARALERLDARWPIDVVHAHYALPGGGAARGWAGAAGRALVVSVHGGDVLSPLLATPAARAETAAVLRGSAAVLCNSRATLERAASLAGGRERMRVVHLGAEAPARPVPPRSEPTVATLGHVVPRKRHADVLEAVRLLAPRHPGLRWLVIGDGPELPALRERVERAGLADRVELAGQLPPERALEALAGAHAMALPSVDEAFGVAYAEALACGVPALGCRGEWGPEEIAGLGPGMTLVPPGDPPALATALDGLLADPARRAELGAAARATAAEHLSWPACGRATVAAYRDALAHRPSPARAAATGRSAAPTRRR
jgi:glycosyltransferase involved in cell wall biosynthesis